MKIHRTMEHDIPAHEVYEMSCSEAFQEKKCADAGALSWTVRITADGDTAVVSTRRKLPTAGFPSILRKIVPAGVTSTETITWGPLRADGSRLAQLEVDFHGAPAKLAGTIEIVPRGDSAARVEVKADLKIAVPVIGGKIEKVAGPIVLDVIESEERTGLAWAAGSR